jgi:hypothetical protein
VFLTKFRCIRDRLFTTRTSRKVQEDQRIAAAHAAAGLSVGNVHTQFGRRVRVVLRVTCTKRPKETPAYDIRQRLEMRLAVDRRARLTADAARRPAFATLLLFTFATARVERLTVFRAARFVFRANFFTSRSAERTTLLCVKAFCAASAFAAIVPSAAPIDSATVFNSGSLLVFLPLRAFIF